MSRKSRVGFVIATVFTIVNVGGTAFAAIGGELPHAALHVALTILGAFVMWWLAPGRDTDGTGRVQHGKDGMEQLQQPANDGFTERAPAEASRVR